MAGRAVRRRNSEAEGGGGVGTRPWWLALLACGGAYWPLAFEPSAMTRRHPHYCGHPHCRGHPPAPGGESRMQLLPMASSPDGLISARDAVITKTPGWGVLTTTSIVNVTPRAPAVTAFIAISVLPSGTVQMGAHSGNTHKANPTEMPDTRPFAFP